MRSGSRSRGCGRVRSFAGWRFGVRRGRVSQVLPARVAFSFAFAGRSRWRGRHARLAFAGRSRSRSRLGFSFARWRARSRRAASGAPCLSSRCRTPARSRPGVGALPCAGSPAGCISRSRRSWISRSRQSWFTRCASRGRAARGRAGVVLHPRRRGAHVPAAVAFGRRIARGPEGCLGSFAWDVLRALAGRRAFGRPREVLVVPRAVAFRSRGGGRLRLGGPCRFRVAEAMRSRFAKCPSGRSPSRAGRGVHALVGTPRGRAAGRPPDAQPARARFTQRLANSYRDTIIAQSSGRAESRPALPHSNDDGTRTPKLRRRGLAC
jgi:hypothetical protein